jgi:hypothetical protein
VKTQKSLHICAAVIVLSLLFHCHASAAGVQSPVTAGRANSESTAIVGYGTGNVTEGNYEPLLLIWRLGWNLKQFFPALENQTGTLSCYIEPQVNPVFDRETDIECGVGLGLKYMHPLTDSVGAYFFVSVGPHYVSVKTSDQVNGFIFSDTIGAGLSFFVTERSSINVEYRLRHMSNADIEQPNAGINTHFGTIGYSVFF